jgi:small-conductance mechanosensitive channel
MSMLRRALLLVFFVAFFAAPAGAQLDLPWRSPAEHETPAEEPSQPAEAPAAAPESDLQASPPVTRPAPPESIARPALGGPKPPRPSERRPLLILFLSLLGVGLALFIVERARSWITTNIALRRVLGAMVVLLRITAVGLLLGIVLRLIPDGQDWILWALVVLALVIGWSIRDLFADLVAGGIIAAERRVKKGVWVSGEGFQGTVEGRSLRATWLRDGQGHRLTVPNRSMVGAPMVYDAGADAEHEVVVRLEGYDDAGKVRMALTDAILSSPWVLAGANPVVLRDPADPVVWRVRTKLLEPRFSVHFEGELLERVEDLLRYVPEERETVPSELPPDA